MLLHLHPAAPAPGHMPTDPATLVLVQGIQGIDTQQLFEIGVRVVPDHAPLTPAAASDICNRFNPDRMRLFTVPSGSPSMAATSR